MFRSEFSGNWLSDFNWLILWIKNEKACCYICKRVSHLKLMTYMYSNGGRSFIYSGVSNWKKALEKFRKHWSNSEKQNKANSTREQMRG